ncbi:MAG: thioredoxin domain-containing protein [Hyphomicrobiales bacterium]|nr:thioredoxin domain-containing protein [Hyphomicrobiales bacterium]
MLTAISSLKRSLKPAIAALVFSVAALSAAPASAQSALSTAQKTEVEKIIKDYLLKNPAVLRDALINMQKHSEAEEKAKRAEAVSSLSSKLHNSKYQVVLGNPDGKIQLVEFFDYNCGYCRRAMNDLARLMAKNPDLRVVLKEFPVLGQPSKEAAIVATALHKQFDGKKYWEFHRRLMSTRGRVGKAQALAAAKASGADMEKLNQDIDSSDVATGINEVLQIANALNMTGTPSYVVGPDVVVGAVGYGNLQNRINNIRKCGKSSCNETQPNP